MFVSKVSKLHARKKWIVSSVFSKGELVIDDGARKALITGKSLLAAGVKKVSGKFNKGDQLKVKIFDSEVNEIPNKENKRVSLTQLKKGP